MTVPIRLRLTLWYTALLAVIMLAAAAFVSVSLRTDLTRTLDRTLQTSAGEIAADYKPVPSASSESEFRDVTDVSLAGLPRDASAAQIVSGAGVVAVNAGNGLGATPMLPPTTIRAAVAGAASLQTASLNGRDYRIYASPFTVDGQPSALVVATSLENVEAATQRLALLLAIGVPVGVAIAALGGWWLARRALRPIATMTAEAGAIGARRLGDRVEVPATMDELGRLALTLNGMLERIQMSVEQQRAFVSNASHELRTPLAIMRAEIDVSLASDDLAPDAREVLESTREETDRMRAIVEDLLMLARMDEGALSLAAEPVDLTELAADVLATMGSLAAERGVALELTEAAPVRVTGDADRLRQVVRNLVDNGIKYAAREGRVTVAVRAGDPGFGEVSVADTGPGIPTDALPRVFDRFYRVDPARGRDAGGSGLGLAIVRELVEAHGGGVGVASSDAGTEFVVALPVAPERADHRGALST